LLNYTLKPAPITRPPRSKQSSFKPLPLTTPSPPLNLPPYFAGTPRTNYKTASLSAHLAQNDPPFKPIRSPLNISPYSTGTPRTNCKPTSLKTIPPSNHPLSTHQPISLFRWYSPNKLQDRLAVMSRSEQSLLQTTPSPPLNLPPHSAGTPRTNYKTTSLRTLPLQTTPSHHSTSLPTPPVLPEQITRPPRCQTTPLRTIPPPNHSLSPLNLPPCSAGTPRTNHRTARHSSRQGDMSSQCEPDRRRLRQMR